MQVSVAGMPANALVSTVVWQYRQSMPLPCTCRWWLKGMGCCLNWFTWETVGPQYTAHDTPTTSTVPTPMPIPVHFTSQFAPGGKTCAIPLHLSYRARFLTVYGSGCLKPFFAAPICRGDLT